MMVISLGPIPIIAIPIIANMISLVLPLAGKLGIHPLFLAVTSAMPILIVTTPPYGIFRLAAAGIAGIYPIAMLSNVRC